MESLLNLKTDETTTFVIQDILRMVTIQVFTQMLFVMNNNDISFFNMKFIKTTIFICLSILVYWLIIRRLITPEDKEKDKSI